MRVMEPFVEVDEKVFGSHFDKKPFYVQHSLGHHPLFTLPRLVELARSLPAEYVEYNAGNLPVGVRPGETPRNGLSAEETLRRIAECGSWMVLKRVEQEPAYRELLHRCLDDIAVHARGLTAPMRDREGFIFISSPGSVTPFHIDHEYNFLLQVRGSKTVSMWDPQDRVVLPEQELESFHARFVHRNLPWRDEFQNRAWLLPLEPGQGLHFPVTVPHWVKNGPEVSVSFSITFRTDDSDRRAMVYRANARLRSLGFDPAPPGRSILLDRTKQVAIGSLSKIKQAIAPFAKPR